MSDYHYTIVYGDSASKNGTILNIQFESIEYAKVLDYIKNIQYPYVDLVKSKKPYTNKEYRRIYNKLKTIYMHYRPECPFTEKSIDVILRTPIEVVIRLWNIHTNGKQTKSIVEQYLKSRGISHVTFPQFFYKGEPLGGADNLGRSLSKIFNVL